jgi:putative membrane protein
VIETAGGQGPEASLSVLSRAEAERLRRAVFERASRAVARPEAEHAEVVPAEQRQLIRKLSLLDLFGAGITSNHILSALAVVGTLWAFLDDVLPETFYQQVVATVMGGAQELMHQDTWMAVVVVVVGLIAVFGISMIFSIIGSIVLFYNFTFSRSGEDLHRSYGLLTLRSSSLPRRRIQVLEVEEKLLRRLFGLVTLRADTVSGGKEDREENSKGRDVLLPVLARDEVDDLLPVFFPDLMDEETRWHRVSRLAIKRNMFISALVCALIIAGLLFFIPWPLALLPLLILPLIYWISVKNYDSFGYSLGENYFQTRRGWLGRSTHIVPIRKVQAVAIQRNPIDRSLGLATLMIDTAGQAHTGGGPQISNLPLEEAEDVARRLAQRAAATQYKI